MIALSDNRVEENSLIGTLIGTLSAIDQDSDQFEFTLLEGSDLFKISNDSLQVKGELDYEAAEGHTVLIRVNDGENNFDEMISFFVEDVNEAPTDISLTSTNIALSDVLGSTRYQVATLETVDQDIDDLHTYSLVSGEGDGGNMLFDIEENHLILTETSGIKDRSVLEVRLNTQDNWILVNHL